ncbi:MAG: HlyD family efflux transporter periplasmic adaptor subunit [Actinomycetota bacterium]
MGAVDGAAHQVDAGQEVARAFPVTDRKGWVAVLGLAVVFIGVLGWLFFGQLPQEVRGDAIIVPTDGFIDVGRNQSGVLSELFVSPGDEVVGGDVIARLRTDSGPVVVTAPIDGTIANILERVGGSTDPGQPLMTMSATEGGEQAVAFVPAGWGNTIQIGMPARVALEAYPQSQFGTMEGTVSAVSTLPVTSERLDVLLGGNDALENFLSAQGPLLEVTITLIPDPSSATGYKWTIGAGPDRPIPVGSLGDGSVIIAEGSAISRFLR